MPHYYLVDYADLAIIDLGKATTLEGRRELAVQVREAMATIGFFYVINHGLTPAQVSTYHFGQSVDQTYNRPNGWSISRTLRLQMWTQKRKSCTKEPCCKQDRIKAISCVIIGISTMVSATRLNTITVRILPSSALFDSCQSTIMYSCASIHSLFGLFCPRSISLPGTTTLMFSIQF